MMSNTEDPKNPRQSNILWCNTSTKLKHVNFKWTIENFLFLLHSKKIGQKLKSSSFSAEGDPNIQWCLYIFPKGIKDAPRGNVSLFLCLVSSNRPEGVLTQFELSIKNDKGETLYSQGASGENFVENMEGKGYRTFLLQSQLLEKDSTYLSKGNLLIHCAIHYQIETVTRAGRCPSNAVQLEAPETRVTHHLDQLLESECFSDITFSIDGREFRAHKLILVSRSPFFAALLQHDMKGRLLDYLEVESIRPEVFQEVLRFIYTDRVNNMENLSEDLLAAADRYRLDFLKFQCEQFLANRLSLENCLHFLSLADIHSASQLKKLAVSFVESRLPVLVPTEAWSKMVERRPQLAIQILQSRIVKEDTAPLM